jgi:hypothetical protein
MFLPTFRVAHFLENVTRQPDESVLRLVKPDELGAAEVGLASWALIDRSEMAKLTPKQRAAMKPSQFGLPEKARTKKARQATGNYPMPDRGHAVSAVRLAKKNHKDGNLSTADYKRIRRKAHKILKKD